MLLPEAPATVPIPAEESLATSKRPPAGRNKAAGGGAVGVAAGKGAGVEEGLVQRGPLLVTRQGVSGPAVLKLSAFGSRLMSEAKYR